MEPSYAAAAPIPFEGTASYEEQILHADVIARVSLVSTTTGAEQWVNIADVHHAAMVFTFTVHEYLKGLGGTTITAIATDSWLGWDTREDALAEARRLIAVRNTTYDNRQAIVFLKRADVWPSTMTGDRYLLGSVRSVNGEDNHSIAGRWYKPWLPDAAATTSGASSRGVVASTEQSFLLDDPRNPTADPPINGGNGRGSRGSRAAGGASGGSSAPTLSMTDLKAAITRISADDARGDGSALWDFCMDAKYRIPRFLAWRKSEGHMPQVLRYDLASGLAAGSVVAEYPGGLGLMPDNYGTLAWAGADAHYFGLLFGAPEYTLNILVKPPGPPDFFRFTSSNVSRRPLSAGEYAYTSTGLPASRVVCNAVVAEEAEWRNVAVTVTAPASAVYEAMFDPVADGSAVKATSVLKPYTATGADTATVSDISWESGTLKIGMDPVTAHTGKYIDFIAQDGTLPIR